MTVEFCTASCNQSALMPDISLLRLQTHRPPFPSSVRLQEALDEMHNTSSGLPSFWDPGEFIREKPNMRQKGGRRVSLAIYPLALLHTRSSWVLSLHDHLFLEFSSLSLFPCPVGSVGFSFTLTRPRLLPCESDSQSMVAGPGTLEMQVSRPPRPTDRDTLWMSSSIWTRSPGASEAPLSLRTITLGFPVLLYAQLC